MFESLKAAKVTIVALAASVFGVLLLWLAEVQDRSWTTGFPSSLPIAALGGALLSAGIVILAFELVVRRESTRQLESTVVSAFATEHEATRNAVVDSLRVGDRLAEVSLTESQLDRLIENALGLRLGNVELGRDMGKQIQSQVAGHGELWRNLNVAVTFAVPQPRHGSSPDGQLLRAVTHWSYETNQCPERLVFRLAKDRTEYADVIRAREAVFVHSPPPTLQHSGEWHEELGVSEVRVGREDLPIQLHDETQSYLAGVPDRLRALGTDQPVMIEYRTEVLLDMFGHVLAFEVPRPCRNVSYAIDAGDSPLKRIRVLDFFSSTVRPSVRYRPNDVLARAASVDLRDWVFPKAGVMVVWEAEQHTSDPRLSSVTETEGRDSRGGLAALSPPAPVDAEVTVTESERAHES